MSAKNRILSEEETEEQKEYTERVGRISAEFEQTHGRKPRFFSATYGCQQNENDTERLDGMLLQMGYEYTEDKDLADLILLTHALFVNTPKQKFSEMSVHLSKTKEKIPILKFAFADV